MQPKEVELVVVKATSRFLLNKATRRLESGDSQDYNNVLLTGEEARRLLSSADVQALMTPVLREVHNKQNLNVTSATDAGGGNWDIAFEIVMPEGVSENDASVQELVSAIDSKNTALKDPSSTTFDTFFTKLQAEIQQKALTINLPSKAELAASVQSTVATKGMEVRIVYVPVPMPAPAPVVQETAAPAPAVVPKTSNVPDRFSKALPAALLLVLAPLA
jgi:hypothetical protein